MAVPVRSVECLIGNTPLIELRSAGDAARGVTVFGKLESTNPGHSVKDRSALQLLTQAVADHALKPGWTIVESTSGNMGHALAMLCAVRGYHFICILDIKTPASNVALVRAFGGEVHIVTTPDETGSYQRKRIALARSIAARLPHCVNLDQYNNPAAIDAHFRTTGPEIYTQTEGRLDALFASASTGSHLSGIAGYLKSCDPAIRIFGVEPVGSAVFGGEYKPYLQNGAGLSFRPGNIRTELVDEVVRVADGDAFSTCRNLARSEGLLLGGSSGAVVSAAHRYARALSGPARIVVVLADDGMKYLETIYNDEWLKENGLEALLAGEAEDAQIRAASTAGLASAREPAPAEA